MAAQPTTHYEVLGLTPSILDDQHDPSTLIKRAYHRALLRNHPDKASQGHLNSASTSTTTSLYMPSRYTIDQIAQALAVLSSPSQRAAYDTTLHVSRSADADAVRFQTGVVSVDLDDLDYDETKECWYRGCRCGNDRAYSFREEDLLEAGDDGELMVGCEGCSLWLRVHFAMVDDEKEDFTPDASTFNTKS